ncbi:MAG: hypothetical protein WCF61_02525, partial [Terriglobales bacterium]
RAFVMREAVMKRTISLLTLLMAVFVILFCARALAQDKTPVKVKSSEVVTGVVIVHVQKGGETLELQCNQGAGSCKTLASGYYLMVELPKNYGMYDCNNVEIYKGDADKPEAAELVGAYCLMEK